MANEYKNGDSFFTAEGDNVVCKIVTFGDVSKCGQCHFDGRDCSSIRCNPSERSDNKSVIFTIKRR